ncbi:MAG TPA: TonB-dependent receptor [Kofleriaceae bacterium]|nr:TonB-dependent receptor [Kofleriaceae bacterium]
MSSSSMRGPAWALVVAVSLALGGVASVRIPEARADSTADEADARFLRGNQLFKSARYDEALVEFLTSNRLVRNRNVIFNIARTYEALGRLEEAYRYYADYIRDEPNRSERAEAQRRLRLIEPQIALLSIESDPPGASVYLERKDLGGRGETPLLLAVTPGTYKVIVEAKGYRDAATTAEAVRGRAAEIRSKLSLIVGKLVIASRPRAAVYIDRAAGTAAPPVALSTPTVLELPPGRHEVELVAPGHRPGHSNIIVQAGMETRVDLALEERAVPTGTVVLASQTAGALVLVDGVERGFTPAVLDLSVGAHAIEVRGEGYGRWRQDVDVGQDSRVFYQVEMVEVEPEVTGATRAQQSLSEAPASVTLVTRDEIWRLGYQTVIDVVRGVRGIYASDDQTYESIGVRGFSRPGESTNRLLVAQDGHAMNNDTFGSAAVGRDFAADLDDVSRIEIVRGPGSAFYGPGAFFGVIEVVTEEPGYGPPVRAGGSLGSDGTGLVFARGTAGDRRAGVSVYASVYESDGSAFHVNEFEDGPTAGDVIDGDAESAQRGTVRARFGELSFDGSLVHRRKFVPTAPYLTVFGEPFRMTDVRGYGEARWQHRRGPLDVTARASYDRHDNEALLPLPFGGPDGFVRGSATQGGQWLTSELRMTLEGLGQRFTLGAEGSAHDTRQDADLNTDGMKDFDREASFVNGSVYASDEVAMLGDRVRLSAGVRAERFGEQKDSAVSPRLALIVRPYDSGYTKLIVGRAFRAPSPYEIYYFSGFTGGEPESLVPETIWTAEVEHTHTFWSRSHLVLSVFGSRIAHLITLSQESAIFLHFQNTAEDVVTAGGEVEVRLGAKNGAWWSAAMSGTSVRSDNDDARINSVAAVGSFRGYLPLLGDRLGLAGDVIYNGPRPRRDGVDSNAALIGRLFLSGRMPSARLLYRIGITNLLDWDWSIPTSVANQQQQIPQQDRMVHAQLVYEFE